MNIVQAIDQLVPKAQYFGYPRDREHYENLRWRDERDKPSWEEIEALLSQEVSVPDPVETRYQTDPAYKALVDEIADIKSENATAVLSRMKGRK